VNHAFVLAGLAIVAVGAAAPLGLRRSAARGARRHRSQADALADLQNRLSSPVTPAEIEETVDDHLFDPPPAQRLPAFPAQRNPDLTEGRRLRDEGIQRATDNAPEQWKQQAWAALLRVIARGGEFTTDAVWEELDAAGVPRPKEPKAISGVFRRGINAKLIVNTGRTEETAQRQAHARRKAIWRVRDRA
jgi:hypothetical protein